jgi:site-specific recombinase XerD
VSSVEIALGGSLRHSPARLLKNGRTDRPIPKALTDDEVRRFEKALAVAAKESALGRRDQVLFTLRLKSGMRLTAALAINVEDLTRSSAGRSRTRRRGFARGASHGRRVTP